MPSPSIGLNLVNITVDVEHAQTYTGNMNIALYSNSSNFLQKGKEVYLRQVPVRNAKLRHIITGVAIGQYALAVYHDVNADGRLNKNRIGFPTEPYAFSNNFKPVFGPPSFKDAQFGVRQNTSITIKLLN